jgi:hypothetical protein
MSKEYYKRILEKHDDVIKNLEKKIPLQTTIGKKRTYNNAFGYDNDYEIVQNRSLYIINEGTNWTDAYLEHNK